MPKKLSAEEQVADPVRSRLESTSRIASLAGQAAAPARRQAPASPRVAPEPEPVVELEPERPRAQPVREAPPRSALRHEYEPEQEATDVARKARFTKSEADANLELVGLISRLTGSKPSESSVTRILWSLLREAESGLKQQGKRGITLRRPPNGSTIEMAAYERDLGHFLLSALKGLEL